MAQQDTDQIFREVDEELRKERFEQLWKEYGTYVAAAAVAIVLAVGGWKLTEYLQAKRTFEAGAKFNAAMLLLEGKKPEDAEKALRDLGLNAPGGYPALARMRVAAIEQADGRVDAAAKAYDAIAADGKTDTLLRGLASIKAAMLRIDTAGWTEMQNRLTPLKDVKGPWELSARELLGLAAWKSGKLAEAEAEYLALIGNRDLSPGMRQRVEMMLALVVEAKSAGSDPVVPAPAATAPPQGEAKEQGPAKGTAAKGGTAKGGQK
jgi:hypothetical protein